MAPRWLRTISLPCQRASGDPTNPPRSPSIESQNAPMSPQPPLSRPPQTSKNRPRATQIREGASKAGPAPFGHIPPSIERHERIVPEGGAPEQTLHDVVDVYHSDDRVVRPPAHEGGVRLRPSACEEGRERVIVGGRA